MAKATNNPAPHAGEKNPSNPQPGQTPGMAAPPAEQPTDTDEQPTSSAANPSRRASGDDTPRSYEPSFSSTEDDPLATAGTGGSEDPKGKRRPGGGRVPEDSRDDGER